jgi:hypothetical protein
MRKISRSVHFVKQAKTIADCTIRTMLRWKLIVQAIQPYNDVADVKDVEWEGMTGG